MPRKQRELKVNYTFPKNISTIVTQALLDCYERNKDLIDKKFEEMEAEEKKERCSNVE